MNPTASQPAPLTPSAAPNLQGMDMGAVNLAQAIRQTESSGNFSAKGSSGEFGAYQWTPDTWKSQAQQILGDSSAPMTPQNQNAVAYGVIKTWKDSGLNAAQIAAKWNSGSETGWENKIGTNSSGVAYNVPQYVKSVTDAYQTIKGGGQVGADPNNPSSTASNQPPSLGGFAQNAISSAGGVLSALGGAILHPIKTVETIGNTAIGAGEAAGKALSGNTGFDSSQLQTFNTVKDYFAKRYGGSSVSQVVSNIGHTLYTDPVGAALDLSTLLDGAASAVGAVGKISDVSKAGELAKAADFISTANGVLKSGDPAAIDALRTNGSITKIADAMKTVSDFTNPLTAAGKVAGGAIDLGGRIAGESLGLSTGAGYGAVRGAFDAGSAGGAAQAAFRAGISGGEAGQEGLVKAAQDAFQSIKSEQQSTYQSQLEQISNDAKSAVPAHTLTPEAITPVYERFNQLLQKFDVVKNVDGTLDFSNSRLASEPSSMTDIQQISKELDKYLNGVKQVSPANIDHLKQFITDRYTGGSRGSAFTTPLADSVRQILKKNVPGYSEMTAGYAKTSGELKDLKQLSLGGKAGKETIIKKLTSTIRGNNEYRLALLKQLENKSGTNLISQASGSALGSFVPAGLTKYAEGLAIVFNPHLVAALPFESPRLVGEFVNAVGKGNRYLENIGNALIKYKADTALKVGAEANKSVQP